MAMLATTWIERCLLALAIGSATSTAVIAAQPGSAPDSGTRVVLPADITPDHYRIDIVPDAAKLEFTGTVEVDLTVHKATDRIVLNSAAIGIDRAAVNGEAARPGVRYDDYAQTLTLLLGGKLKPGSHTLTLDYHGRIYRQASGLFALDYGTPAGTARALFTQFQTADARRFVPCWDEPGSKASFALTATVPSGQMAISNMPIESTEPLSGDRKRVHFAPTPRMSPYLLFFAVGDFERLHREVAGVDVAVVVKRGDMAHGGYALDAAADLLPYFNDYFGVPYPLPKLDLVAAPGRDFSFDAMENWGAIFFFEKYLLIDPRLATEGDRRLVYLDVAHEIAHQWFGNLVTMAWWDDLWLNEGFATWMQDKVTDHFHPDWRVWLQTLVDKERAMDVDILDGTHPVITTIRDAAHDTDNFDDITYRKGAAVIRTLESLVGEDLFRAGIRRYVHDHAYGNAVTDDLWASLGRNSRWPIRQIAHDLTLQAGVPMVSEVYARCEDGRTRLGLRQGQFAADPGAKDTRTWHLPVTVAPLSGAASATVVSGPAISQITVDGCGPFVLNAGQAVYTRSRYARDDFAVLLGRYGALSPDDQLGLLFDTGSLALAGLVPMADLLELAGNVPADANPVILSVLAGRLQTLDLLFDGLPGQAAFRTYASGVLGPAFRRTGWDKIPGEPAGAAILRTAVILALGQFGDPAVLAEAGDRYARFLADDLALDAETRRSVLAITALRAGQAAWDQLHAKARSARTGIERQQLYELLAGPADEGLARQALELAISGEPPSTLVPDMITLVAQRHATQTVDFVMSHWDRVASFLEAGSQGDYVAGLVANRWDHDLPRQIASAWDPALVAKLDAFARDHVAPAARQTLRRSQSSIRLMAEIRRIRLPEVDAWLRHRQTQAGTGQRAAAGARHELQ